jgi:anion-transporting  ArsA/GET3 family ATPase
MRIDPYEALTEYLGLQLHLRSLVRGVLRNRAFHQLMDAAPGWRELITLGKVWHLEQATDERGRPRFDLLLVDAPATGHGLTFLEVPHVVVSAIRAGPLRRHAGWVEALIQDQQRTLLLPVSLAEELPARETAQLVARVRKEIGIAVDRVVVNGFVPSPFPPEVPDLDERLAGLPSDLPLPGAPSPGVLAACAAHLRGRYEINRRWAQEIARTTGLPLYLLPQRLGGLRGPEDLEALGEHLLAHPVAL